MLLVSNVCSDVIWKVLSLRKIKQIHFFIIIDILNMSTISIFKTYGNSSSFCTCRLTSESRQSNVHIYFMSHASLIFRHTTKSIVIWKPHAFPSTLHVHAVFLIKKTKSELHIAPNHIDCFFVNLHVSWMVRYRWCQDIRHRNVFKTFLFSLFIPIRGIAWNFIYRGNFMIREHIIA